MKKKILVGITQRADKIKSHNEWRDSLDHRLFQWVTEAGFVPVPIPNTLANLDYESDNQQLLKDWTDTVGLDAIVLSGGGDIGEFPQRDLTENYLLLWAEKYRLPVLGICRGMQLMGLYFGAKLIEVKQHVGTRHNLVCEKDSFLLSNTVNSYHNFALDKCPSNFKAIAYSEDGSLEAMAHNDLSWEAWMWHPEREDVFSDTDLEKFTMLIENAK